MNKQWHVKVKKELLRETEAKFIRYVPYSRRNSFINIILLKLEILLKRIAVEIKIVSKLMIMVTVTTALSAEYQLRCDRKVIMKMG
jgi:hypothetical protein